MFDPEVFVLCDALVGEGPVVEEAAGRLVFVDIPRGRLLRADLRERGPATEIANVGMSLGAVAPRRSGGWVAACAEGFGTLIPDGDLIVRHPVLADPALRMNDAKCDSAGRFWAGSTETSFEPGRGALHCWDPRRGVRTVAEGLTLPNGLGWSPDDSVFYLADSMRQVVLAAAFDVRAGTIGPFSELIHIQDGLPDGLCVDEDGCLWLAVWGAGQVRRYDPRGRLLAAVRFPVSQPSSCAFGPDGVLFVTSARERTDAAREPLAGSVFAVDAGLRGLPASIFED
ncbi:sugar lactone lactonase YvrE [Catenulispora sp. GP43]|uniref:SMP-30/gluconolactonase/LRE family protein n=1 Tax=Catenulispora sp. GP43 TaxID=3156263 RepID=UPI003511683E